MSQLNSVFKPQHSSTQVRRKVEELQSELPLERIYLPACSKEKLVELRLKRERIVIEIKKFIFNKDRVNKSRSKGSTKWHHPQNNHSALLK